MIWAGACNLLLCEHIRNSLRYLPSPSRWVVLFCICRQDCPACTFDVSHLWCVMYDSHPEIQRYCRS
jgi:hypothetical protein